MNDSCVQHAAQTPTPATGSRQATQSVGSAISSAVRAAWDNAPEQARHTPRSRSARGGEARLSVEASMGDEANPRGGGTQAGQNKSLAPDAMQYAVLRR
ncbi:MAG: hypothetical protein NTAFB05_31340 [Nitrobacter sp.]